MEQKGVQLDQETLSCWICLDLLKDLGTIPCGHSYCMSCIQTQWDGEDGKNLHSCPQCRHTFIPRPVLVKNTMLADLVEQLKKTGLGAAAAADRCYAGAEDVVCDVCTGRKLKAVQSCLVCLASYCDQHLQSHYNAAPLKKHKLVDPSEKLQENVCSCHDEVMKMFCCTDGQCICYLCSVEEHKGHDTVSSAAERTERQKELEVSRQKIQQRIKDKQKDVKVLQQEAENISRCADEAAEKNRKILTELIRLMEERRSDVERQIRSKEETEVSRVKELEWKLEQEMTELRRKDAEMDKRAHTHQHNQLLLQYPSVSTLREDPDSSHVHVRPQSYFEDVTTAVSELREKLQLSLTEERTNMELSISQTQVLLEEPEPQTRTGFLQYSCRITLDPNTVNEDLSLSEKNRRVTYMRQKQNCPDHPDRFSFWYQVLSRESLTGRCYWEVEWREGVNVTVAYKDIKRKGTSSECRFGYTDKSWALHCDNNFYVFLHNSVWSSVPGPVSSRIGVYLDHTAGILSFYSVSETMTLIHRVQTTFTKPLYAGLWLLNVGSTAHFPKLH
ncbi:tripartite motif-containing protein 16-like isoform X2 [Sphaeramia orbicularis]|uniref:tripartite motif-containing protein 16-like isoform X2 n=1 Tax=Sphaeramia orbicularis TaxID=375764 RepID=UPI0011809E8B|nr:tripartite motif-containing protein 16-like isoform X2 [Sphaeramia orbicularis]